MWLAVITQEPNIRYEKNNIGAENDKEDLGITVFCNFVAHHMVSLTYRVPVWVGNGFLSELNLLDTILMILNIKA